MTTLRTADASTYAALDDTAATIGKLASDSLTAAGVEHQLQYAGNFFCVFFSPTTVLDFAGAQAAETWRYKAFFHAMLDAGVYLPPSAFEAWFVNAAIDADALAIVEAPCRSPHARPPRPRRSRDGQSTQVQSTAASRAWSLSLPVTTSGVTAGRFHTQLTRSAAVPSTVNDGSPASSSLDAGWSVRTLPLPGCVPLARASCSVQSTPVSMARRRPIGTVDRPGHPRRVPVVEVLERLVHTVADSSGSSGLRAPTVSSASSRWMSVSCAMRRRTKPTV